ncbi:hypothetical protein ACFVH6_11200 [Spirillospora sp. NPDC127200]
MSDPGRRAARNKEDGVRAKPDKPMSDAELLATSPFPEDDGLTAAPSRRSLPVPTLVLVSGLLLVAGFIGGVQAQKWRADDGAPNVAGPGNRTAAGGHGRNMQNNAPGGRPYGGQNGMPPGGGNGNGDMTLGTVTAVGKDSLTLRTADGRTVKVRTSGKTRITVTKNGTVADLGAGTTVMVRGTAGSDGAVTATTVSEAGGMRRGD